MDRYTQLMALLSTVLVAALLVIVIGGRQEANPVVQETEEFTQREINTVVSQHVSVLNNTVEHTVDVQ